MKVGRGRVRPMSKTYKKCTSLCAILALTTLALLLTGCGQMSLNQLLQNEEPGDLSINPLSANLPTASTIEIEGKGGFPPYNYENISSKGTLDGTTGEYIAPSSAEISGNFEVIEIEVTDSFGTQAATFLTIYKSLDMSPTSKTVEVGSSVTFNASGGVPAPNYDFYVNDVLEGSSSGGWSYTFAAEDTYTIEVVDSLGNRAVATVTALAVGGDLGIDVEEHYVQKNGSITVTVINPAGAHTFSTDPPGVGSFDDPTAVSTAYNAPSTETVVTITVQDSTFSTAEAIVHVLGGVPGPLIVSPSASVIGQGETRALTVVGGVAPYTFWVEGSGSWTAHETVANKVVYHAPDYPTTASVWVEDSIGNIGKATMNVVAD